MTTTNEHSCTPNDRCADMIKTKTMVKIFLSGVAVVVLTAIVSVFFQWRGSNAQVETSVQVEALKKSMDTLSILLKNALDEISYLRDAKGRLEYDGQRTRVFVNKIAKKNGLDPIEVRPFIAPSYEQLLEEYKKRVHKNEEDED